MAVKLKDLAASVEGKLSGDGELEIRGVAALNDAPRGTISFLARSKDEAFLTQSSASAFVVPQGVSPEGINCIEVKNPALAFASIAEIFHPRPAPGGILPGSVIEKNVVTGKDLTIYPNAYIDEGARLGDRVIIYPGVYIGADVVIGDDTLIYPNVVVMEGTEIGSRVIIHGGTVIGSDGYGFQWDGSKHRKIPQVGKVIIGDDVEIGANCAIDRAALSKTEIRKGAKIDNLVHIAHNCIIGEDSLLAGQVGFAGSVEVGKGVMMAGQVGVSGHLKIGDGVILGGKSGVTKDLEAGARVTGYPPLPHRDWLRVQKKLEKLPEMSRQLKEALEKIDKLEKMENEDA
ncbi:MAG: UDP-3-O-(3-hydroxymyristoyl)glucosamine N-acyltransferase [Deltaproteobacteria bacterium]|nr:UDP-3-O-(3-hydroxymyristoyl)glucosamine N-acyltransferase [Deltaproteobacteria bacterium]